MRHIPRRQTTLFTALLACAACAACACIITAGHLLAFSTWQCRTRVAPSRLSRVCLHAKGPGKGPDVRALLERAGLLPPKPTEKWVPEDEAIQFETPLDQLKQNIQDTLIKPNQEALVPEGEEVEFETPLSSLNKGVWQLEEDIGTPLDWIKQSLPQEQLVPEGEELRFQAPLSFLFREDEEVESEEMWSDLIAPLVKIDSVDTMNESNYLTVTLQKPLGVTVEENPRELGGGVSIVALEGGSRAEKLGLQPGFQLLAAGGVAVHGMSLAEAIRPIEAAEDKVQLTFFNGSAEAFYGLLGPKPSWLSAFLHKLHIKHLAWQWQEGQTPKGRTWSWALELLDELRDSGADEETYSSAICAAMEACQKASRWQPALSLLNDLRQMPKTPDLGPYRAALVACDRGGEPLQAMWLLDEMKAKDIEPDAASYDSAINSCRAVLRSLQAQSSVLPTIPDPRPKRRGRRNKRKLL